jgi:hypothetical protein
MPYTTESQELTTADLANVANPQEALEPGMKSGIYPSAEHSGPLLPEPVAQDMRTQWEAIQAEFVDDPRVSVQRADHLVATAIKKLAESFAEERSRLEHQWSKGDDVSTEELRQALRRYRTFFHRLLSV